MSEEKKKYESFKDLRMWQESHELVLILHNSLLPQENFSYIENHMIKLAIDISSSIATTSYKKSFEEKIKSFYKIQDVLTELENITLIALNLNIIDKKIQKSSGEKIEKIKIMIFSMIKKLKQVLNSNEK